MDVLACDLPSAAHLFIGQKCHEVVADEIVRIKKHGVSGRIPPKKRKPRLLFHALIGHGLSMRPGNWHVYLKYLNVPVRTETNRRLVAYQHTFPAV
jgi:hypothetical protein